MFVIIKRTFKFKWLRESHMMNQSIITLPLAEVHRYNTKQIMQ